MKIGIYGGTFNPVHKGHTSLAESLVQQGLVDEVWLLVSPLNPFKQANTAEFAPYDDRLRMTELAVQRKKGLRASDFENHLPLPSYMFNTLCELSKTYPQHEFHLVIGADNWQRFSQWYKSEELIAQFPILIYRRPGYDISDEKWIIQETAPLVIREYKSIKIVDTPLYDISSTQLREAIRKGRISKRWLSAPVVRYIDEKKLYR